MTIAAQYYFVTELVILTEFLFSREPRESFFCFFFFSFSSFVEFLLVRTGQDFNIAKNEESMTSAG